MQFYYVQYTCNVVKKIISSRKKGQVIWLPLIVPESRYLTKWILIFLIKFCNRISEVYLKILSKENEYKKNKKKSVTHSITALKSSVFTICRFLVLSKEMKFSWPLLLDMELVIVLMLVFTPNLPITVPVSPVYWLWSYIILLPDCNNPPK